MMKNQQLQPPDYNSIAFHNPSAYETHLFLKELQRKINKDGIGDIAENKEKYISFNVKINVKLAGVTIKMINKHLRIFS